MQLQYIMYPNTTVDIYIYMYSCGVGLLFGLGVLHCKPKPMHDNQTMFWVTFKTHLDMVGVTCQNNLHNKQPLVGFFK